MGNPGNIPAIGLALVAVSVLAAAIAAGRRAARPTLPPAVRPLPDNVIPFPGPRPASRTHSCTAFGELTPRFQKGRSYED